MCYVSSLRCARSGAFDGSSREYRQAFFRLFFCMLGLDIYVLYLIAAFIALVEEKILLLFTSLFSPSLLRYQFWILKKEIKTRCCLRAKTIDIVKNSGLRRGKRVRRHFTVQTYFSRICEVFSLLWGAGAWQFSNCSGVNINMLH